MKRVIVGNSLVSIGLILSGLLYFSASIAHQAVTELRNDFGAQTVSGWYNLQPARDLFYGRLAFESEIIYLSFLLGPVALLVSLVGALLGCIKTSGSLKVLCFSIGILSLLILFVTWVRYSETINIVSIIVD